MNDRDLAKLLESVDALLRPHLQRSQPLREIVGLVGKWLQERVQAASAAGEASAAPPSGEPARIETPLPAPISGPRVVSPAPAGGAVIVSTPAERALPMTAATVPLRIGDTPLAHVRVAGTSADIGRARQSIEAAAAAAQTENGGFETESREIDLSLVEKRCRLKADSCRVFIERRKAIGDPLREPLVVERVAAMIATAKATPECFLWVFWRERSQPDDDRLRVIAACYDTMAAAVVLVRKIDELGEEASAADTEQAFQLLAEADSALRVALESTWLSSPDVDQDQVHLWLRRETAYRHVFVPRFMRLDDPADPAASESLSQRIAGLSAAIDSRRKHAKAIANALQQVKYHARQLAGKSVEEAVHDWKKMDAAIAFLSEHGVAISDRRIAERLRDVAGLPPPEGVVGPLLARALDGLRAKAGEDDADEPAPGKTWSERVRAVRELLSGKRVVIIGGEKRQEKINAMIDAFDLAECEWVELVEHSSGRHMAAPIRRPETALVLILIRLAGHLHVDEAREYARAAGKPFVNIEAGYGIEQIAEQTLTQVGSQLHTVA